MDSAVLIQAFEARFRERPGVRVFSPGRVNLIGEHIDYNGGRVLPVAIDLGTGFAARATAARQVRVHSALFDETAVVDLDTVAERSRAGHWSDFVVGTLRAFARLGLAPAGADVAVVSDLPAGGGLSSSASFAVGLAWTLNEAWDCGLTRMEVVHLARSVENRFVGVACGVMDPFAVAMGRVGHCMALDCATLACEWVPAQLAGHRLLVVDTRVPRSLAGSKYNERRAECGRALALLRTDYDVDALCELTPGEVERCAALAAEPVPLRRARHAASEQLRVDDAVEALAARRPDRFGRLMMASHASLRDDYEVSCPELDLLVELALEVPGVLGSRMTGAGFGGCTVSLLAADAEDDFRRHVGGAYAARTGLTPRIYPVTPADGVRRLA